MTRITEITTIWRVLDVSRSKMVRLGYQPPDEIQETLLSANNPDTAPLFSLARHMIEASNYRKGRKRWELRIAEPAIPKLTYMSPLAEISEYPKRPLLIHPQKPLPLRSIAVDADHGAVDMESALLAALGRVLAERAEAEPWLCHADWPEVPWADDLPDGDARQKRLAGRTAELTPVVEYEKAVADLEAWRKHALPDLITRAYCSIQMEHVVYDPATDDHKGIWMEEEIPGLTDRLLNLEVDAWRILDEWHERANRWCEGTANAGRAPGEPDVVLCSLGDLLKQSCELWDGQHPDYLEPEFLYHKNDRGIAHGYRHPPRRTAPVGRLARIEPDVDPHDYEMCEADLIALAGYELDFTGYESASPFDDDDDEYDSQGGECSNCQGDPCWCSQYYD